MADPSAASDADTDDSAATDEGSAVDDGTVIDDGSATDDGSDADVETDAVTDPPDGTTGTVRVWLVERTYSDDEQNLIILVYATPDGSRYLRKERALTSFTDERDTTAAVDADPGNLGAVDDPEERDRYAAEAARMAAKHDPDDLL